MQAVPARLPYLYKIQRKHAPFRATLESFNMKHFIYGPKNGTRIWRVFRQEHLIHWLDEESLYFPRPQDWDDPFENILLKQRYHIAGTKTPVEFEHLLGSYFG